MTDQSAQEPTMEEILASIRRIISEDEAPAQAQSAEESHAGPVGAPEVSALETDDFGGNHADDVLELTEPEPEPLPEFTPPEIAPLPPPDFAALVPPEPVPKFAPPPVVPLPPPLPA